MARDRVLDNRIADGAPSHPGVGGRLVQRGGTLWFLRRRWLADLQATSAHISRPARRRFAEGLAERRPAYRAEPDAAVARWVEQACLRLAKWVAEEELYRRSTRSRWRWAGRDEATVARVYFALGGEFDLHWLGRQISGLPADNAPAEYGARRAAQRSSSARPRARQRGAAQRA